MLLDRHSASQIRPCQHCYQLDLCSTSDASKQIPVPEKYPRICAPDSPDPPVGREIGLLYLVPVRQNFEWLIRAVAVATHNVTLGVWNQGVMEAYLCSCAVATSVRVIIWRLCRPQKSSASHCVENREETTAECDGDEIDDGYDPLPTEGGSKFVPGLWNSALLMNAYLDCGMHLIFHGIVAYCVEIMDAFMADHGLTQKFERLVNTYMLDIQSLRLE